MPTLYLVRHGQASFGAADYDQLSALGARQCDALGRWMATRGIAPAAVLRGTLRRHVQSLDALAAGYLEAGGAPLPAATAHPELNEYDSEALIRTVHEGPLAAPDTPEVYRAHFRLLRQALQAWMDGRTQPQGMPSFADFRAGIQRVLDAVRARPAGDVLLLSSGGPIATAVAAVLDAPPASAIELNLRIRNSALTEFAFSASGHRLHAFNQLPHLDDPARADWVSYS